MFPFSYVYTSAQALQTKYRKHLYDQVEMSLIIIESGRGVRPNDVLSLNLCADGDMLSDR
jgi:hypothetical protein